jgi:hypothetical protein
MKEGMRPKPTHHQVPVLASKTPREYRALCTRLAGGGPLGAGEALRLEIGKVASPDFSTLDDNRKPSDVRFNLT